MPATTQANVASLLQGNHQHQHEINVSAHTTSNVNKIHTNKYIEHVHVSFPRKKGTHIRAVTIYRSPQDKAGNESVRIQSALCEVACEQQL